MLRTLASRTNVGIVVLLINLGKRIRQLLSMTNLLSVFADVEEYDVPIH